MKTIIAIAGRKRSGKDSTGNYLEKYGFSPAPKLADPIKEIAMLMFGWTREMVEGIGYDREQIIPELGFSVRQFLQELGSVMKYDMPKRLPAFGRSMGIYIWVRILVRRLSESPLDKMYLTDVRYPEEIEELRRHFDVTVIKLVSDRSPVDEHSSETSVDQIEADYTIVNNGHQTFNVLYNKIDEIMGDVYARN